MLRNKKPVDMIAEQSVISKIGFIKGSPFASHGKQAHNSRTDDNPKNENLKNVTQSENERHFAEVQRVPSCMIFSRDVHFANFVISKKVRI